MTSSYSILFYVPSNKRRSNIDAPSVLVGKALHIYPVIRLSVPEVPVLGSQGYLPGIELVLPLSTPPMKGRYLSLPRSRNSSSLYLFLRILYIHKSLRRERVQSDHSGWVWQLPGVVVERSGQPGKAAIAPSATRIGSTSRVHIPRICRRRRRRLTI